jgi:hypothetical protein
MRSAQKSGCTGAIYSCSPATSLARLAKRGRLGEVADHGGSAARATSGIESGFALTAQAGFAFIACSKRFRGERI